MCVKLCIDQYTDELQLNEIIIDNFNNSEISFIFMPIILINK